MIALALWAGLALAKRPDLGNPKDDACDPAALDALDGTDAATVSAGLLAACPGLPEPLRAWIAARGEGRPSELAREVCPKARGELDKGLSPGFEARMLGVAKSCKLKRFEPTAASGPDALLLGSLLADRLEAAHGSERADRVGGLVAGVTGGRPAGRYGGLAALADGFRLPEVERARADLPDGEVWSLDGGRRAGVGPVVVLVARDATGEGVADLVGEVASREGGAWIAASPAKGPLPSTHEHAPVVGLQVFAGGPPVAVRLAVGPERAVLSFGAAGPQEEGADLAALATLARERLSTAQEFGRDDAPSDRILVTPGDGASAQRVLSAIDALLDDQGEPRFAEVLLARDGALAEWPESL